MGKKPKTSTLGLKLMCSVMLIVMPVFTLLVMLVRQDILEMSKEKLILQSQSGAKAVGTWAECILGELDIYKDIIEEVGMDDPRVFELMGTSYPNHEAYPYMRPSEMGRTASCLRTKNHKRLSQIRKYFPD